MYIMNVSLSEASCLQICGGRTSRTDHRVGQVAKHARRVCVCCDFTYPLVFTGARFEFHKPFELGRFARVLVLGE